MKRYLLFTGSTYYPSGGWRDFQESYETVEQAVESAMAWAKSQEYEELWRFNWANISDSQTMKMVWEDGEYKN